MSRTNFKDLLESGVHFGHLKKKWNPGMAPYVFMERNGIHIIDLNKTVSMLDEAAAAMKQIVKSGRNILFVATKKQAKNIVSEYAQSVNMHSKVNEKRYGPKVAALYNKIIEKYRDYGFPLEFYQVPPGQADPHARVKHMKTITIGTYDMERYTVTATLNRRNGIGHRFPIGTLPNMIMIPATSNNDASKFLALKALNDAEATKKASKANIVADKGEKIYLNIH